MLKKRELENTTLIRTVLMIAVVFFHSISFWNGRWFTPLTPTQIIPFFLYASIWLNSFHIYGFTFVSGYLFYYVKYERGGYRTAKEFLRKKTLRLIVPYLFFAFVWVIPISEIFYKWDLQTIVVRYVLGTSPSQLWFLLMLFGTLFIVYTLSNIIKKNVLNALVVSIVCYGIGFVGRHFIPDWFQIWTAFEYVPFAVIGFVFRQYDITKLYKMPSAIWLIGNIVCLYFSRTIDVTNHFVEFIVLGLSVFSHVFGAVWAFFFIQKIVNKTDWKTNRAISFLCERSMTVYLIHQQVIYILLFIFNNRVSPYLGGTLVFILTVLISLLIASIMKRYKVTRLMTGDNL